MAPYVYILYGSIIVTLVSMFWSKGSKYLGIGMLFWLVLFIAFRGEFIGIDTPEYYSYFKNPQLGYYGMDTHDVGYNFWQKAFKMIIDNAYVYIPVTSMIGLFPICLLVAKRSKNMAMSVFLFLTLGGSTLFLFLYLAAVRQTFAIGLLWIAIFLYYKKDNKKSAVMYILAVLSHASMLLYLPAIFMDKLRFKKIWVYVILGISLCFGLILNRYASYFYLITAFLNYGTYYVDVLTQSTASIGGAMLFLTLIAVLVSYFNTLDSYWDRLFVVGVVYNNLFAFLGDSTRISMPLALFGVISITNTMMSQRVYLRYVILSVVIGYGCSKYFKVLYNNGKDSNMVPYKSLIVK